MRYEAPRTVDDVVALLEAEADARVFAGATDVIPQMRAGGSRPGVLVDLKRIPRLVAVGRADGTWTVGAAAPAARIVAETGLADDFPGLAEATSLIGSDQIQSRASWGGNICNASPAADTVPALMVNEARAVIAGAGGTRTVPVEEVATGPGTTSLAPGEVVVEVALDRPEANTGDAYLRFIPRTEMDIAVVGAAARVTLDADGRCRAARLALGAVAPTVIRVPAAEVALVDRPIDDDTLAAVAAAASAAGDPIDDKRGTAAYRRRVAGVLAKRAVALAAERARARGGAK